MTVARSSIDERFHRLVESEAQFRAALPIPEVDKQRARSELGLAQVLAVCMEGYGPIADVEGVLLEDQIPPRPAPDDLGVPQPAGRRRRLVQLPVAAPHWCADARAVRGPRPDRPADQRPHPAAGSRTRPCRSCPTPGTSCSWSTPRRARQPSTSSSPMSGAETGPATRSPAATVRSRCHARAPRRRAAGQRGHGRAAASR
jgi:hypothetical protein